MTTPTTGAALVILVAFLLPGFVALRFNELTHEVREMDISPFERLLQVVYYSAWVYGILAILGLALRPLGWPVDYSRQEGDRLVQGDQPVWVYLVLVALILLVIPAAIATSSRIWQGASLLPVRAWVLRKLKINPNHRTPTAWDHVFLPARRLFVLITLTDGRVVAGTYENDSFAAHTSAGGDLYLLRRWSLTDEGWFDKPAEGTSGVWVPRSSIVSVEFYDVPHDPPTAADSQADPDGEEGGPPPTPLDSAGQSGAAEAE